DVRAVNRVAREEEVLEVVHAAVQRVAAPLEVGRVAHQVGVTRIAAVGAARLQAVAHIRVRRRAELDRHRAEVVARIRSAELGAEGPGVRAMLLGILQSRVRVPHPAIHAVAARSGARGAHVDRVVQPLLVIMIRVERAELIAHVGREIFLIRHGPAADGHVRAIVFAVVPGDEHAAVTGFDRAGLGRAPRALGLGGGLIDTEHRVARDEHAGDRGSRSEREREHPCPRGRHHQAPLATTPPSVGNTGGPAEAAPAGDRGAVNQRTPPATIAAAPTPTKTVARFPADRASSRCESPAAEQRFGLAGSQLASESLYLLLAPSARTPPTPRPTTPTPATMAPATRCGPPRPAAGAGVEVASVVAPGDEVAGASPGDCTAGTAEVESAGASSRAGMPTVDWAPSCATSTVIDHDLRPGALAST